MAGSTDPDFVADDELLFRSIPASTNWYRPDIGFIDPAALTPNKNDVTGLSLGRAGLHGAEQEAAMGRAGKKYYIAVLLASDVKAAGGVIVPRPLADNPGHAEIPNLTYQARKSDEALKLIQALRSAVVRVEGPFEGRTIQ